jgi:hypothetical protein
MNGSRLRLDAIAFILALTGLRAGAQTNGTTSDGLVYSINSGAITITGYTGTGGAVTIPSTIDGNPVTNVDDFAFSGAHLTSISVPNGITALGLYSFEFCVGLTGVTVPASVTSVGVGAFYGCSAMTAIFVDPNNPNFTSDGVVLFNRNQTEIVEYPAGKTGGYAIPGTVTEIGNSAFASCPGLSSISIPNGVTNIDVGAFSTCSGLTGLTIPASVTSIERSAFSQCFNLTTFVVDGGNPNFSSDGVSLFNKGGTELLEYVTDTLGSYSIPSGVNIIAADAFYGASISSVTIPSSVTSIENSAFEGCANLGGITIPSGVTSIGADAFFNCYGLTSIFVDVNNPAYGSDGVALFNKSKTELVEYPTGRAGSYAIPAGVTDIGFYAFSDCFTLNKVTIPASVTTIERGAFSGCSGLTGVTIPANVTSIESDAFQGCSSLTQVTFLGNAPLVDPTAFQGLDAHAALTFIAGTSGWTNPFDGLSATAPIPSPLSARLINISTRAQVGTGGSILIPGFVISGAGTETLLIRGDGPSLTQFNVTGVLAQPRLSVYDSTQHLIASNTGWGTNANPSQIARVFQQVGAFAFQSDTADCALIAELPAGQYTVQISGVGDTTGVALAEVYEVATTGTRLVNISTRAEVGTGGNILIPGFVISGSGTEQLLVRADGPGLAQFSVPGILAQPTLGVFDNTATVIASNTVWGTSSDPSQISAFGAEVGAFALTQGSADSAQVVSLSAGAYTIQVSGADSSTGVALAEVYEVP